MNCISVADKIIAIAKGSYVDCYINQNHNIIKIQDSTGIDETVRDLAISNDNKYLAILTSSKKLITHKLPFLEFMKSFSLPRSASKIRFGVENSHIFVADKTGDVLFYDLLNEDGGVKLLGHLSLLLNVLQSHDGKYLISSDRDEKIRISCYPNTYNIQTYCLGHKEFVNHIEFLPHNDKYLLSASGDGTVKCWDYAVGHICCTIETRTDISDQSIQEDFKKVMDEDGIEVDNLPIVHFSTSKLNETTSLIAVSVYSCNNLLIYSLETIDYKFHHNLVQKISLENYPGCIGLYDKSLFVFDNCDNILTEYKVTNISNIISVSKLQTIKMFADHDNETVVKTDFEHIKVLFKRKFDNVQEYQERKKNRLIKLT